VGVVNQQPAEVSGKTIFKMDGGAKIGKYQVSVFLED